MMEKRCVKINSLGQTEKLRTPHHQPPHASVALLISPDLFSLLLCPVSSGTNGSRFGDWQGRSFCLNISCHTLKSFCRMAKSIQVSGVVIFSTATLADVLQPQCETRVQPDGWPQGYSGALCSVWDEAPRGPMDLGHGFFLVLPGAAARQTVTQLVWSLRLSVCLSQGYSSKYSTW